MIEETTKKVLDKETIRQVEAFREHYLAAVPNYVKIENDKPFSVHVVRDGKTGKIA